MMAPFNATSGNTRNRSPNNSYSRNRSANIVQRLQRVLDANQGYTFYQQNGQRIFEPSSSMYLNPPQKGCEIFIGNIPKYLYEDALIPLFQEVGQLYRFRLLLDFNQKNRGYAFATYFFADVAKKAIEKYNGYSLGNGAALAVSKSIDNRRLFVGNIPRCATKEDVLNMFVTAVDGLVDVIVYRSWASQEFNRGFAFLEFKTHTLASVARRQLHPRNLVVSENSLYVDWADPIPDVDPDVMAQVSVLYVKNLPYELSNDQVCVLFRNLLEPRLVKKTHKIMTYAFIHCYNRMAAEVVMRRLTGFRIDGQTLEIEWARPREYSSQWRSTQPPDNFCLSVPLRSRNRIKQARSGHSPALETQSASNSSPSSSEQ